MKKRDKYYSYHEGGHFAGQPVDKVFQQIYENARWRVAERQESVSGPGSSLEQTRHITASLPPLLEKYGVGSVLDIPCGDFNWMRQLDWSRISYTGADVVEDLVRENRARYRADRIDFVRLDLTVDRLPRVDLVLCRDCLVHFSYSDIGRALAQLRASGSRYLLTTTFPLEEANKDIITGGWRLINLGRPPFRFPPPLELINERCTEADGLFADKSLGLWSIQELPALTDAAPDLGSSPST